jgi:hypothetical protein
MNPGLAVAALVVAIVTVALGARQVFSGRATGWPGAGLIAVVGISALFLVLAVILYLVWAFACGWGRGPCL